MPVEQVKCHSDFIYRLECSSLEEPLEIKYYKDGKVVRIAKYAKVYDEKVKQEK